MIWSHCWFAGSLGSIRHWLFSTLTTLECDPLLEHIGRLFHALWFTNQARFHAITANRVASIHFHDYTSLNIAQEATYLGSNRNHTVDRKRKVSQRPVLAGSHHKKEVAASMIQ